MFCEFIIAYKISFVNSKLLLFNNFFLKFSFGKIFRKFCPILQRTNVSISERSRNTKTVLRKGYINDIK